MRPVCEAETVIDAIREAFHDTFVYHRQSDSWGFRLESADSTGGWRLFAEYDVRRR